MTNERLTVENIKMELKNIERTVKSSINKDDFFYESKVRFYSKEEKIRLFENLIYCKQENSSDYVKKYSALQLTKYFDGYGEKGKFYEIAGQKDLAAKEYVKAGRCYNGVEFGSRYLESKEVKEQQKHFRKAITIYESIGDKKRTKIVSELLEECKKVNWEGGRFVHASWPNARDKLLDILFDN